MSSPVADVREVVFWFNYNSPYSMLAHFRIGSLLPGSEVRVRYRPWFTGVKLPDYASPRVRYVVEDVIRHARAYGLALRPGAYVDLEAACRGFLFARRRGAGRLYNDAVYRARWLDGLDVADPGVLRRIGAGCGLDAEEFGASLVAEELGAELKAEVEEGRAQGVFGVPFFQLEGQNFWGNDRLDWLVAALGGAGAPR